MPPKTIKLRQPEPTPEQLELAQTLIDLRETKPHVFAKPEYTYWNLRNLLARPLDRISVPPILLDQATASILPTIKRFPSFGKVIFITEKTAKLLENDINHPARGGAKYLLSVVGLGTQIPAWKKFADFVNKKKPQANIAQEILIYASQAAQLLERVLLRVHWLFQLSSNSGTPFNPEECLLVIGIDRSWINDVDTFMHKIQAAVCLLRQKYSLEYAEYVEINKKSETLTQITKPFVVTQAIGSGAETLSQAAKIKVAQKSGSPIYAPSAADKTLTESDSMDLNI